MKACDLFSLALRGIKSTGTVLILLTTAVFAFCACFSTAIFEKVGLEKAKPYELDITSSDAKGIPASVLSKIRQIEGVSNASFVLRLPVTVKSGKYIANLEVAGIDGAYLKKTYDQGSCFPENVAMPSLVINDAACKLFSDGSTMFLDQIKAPPIDWLRAGFVVQSEGGQGVSGGISGIIEQEADDEEPLAFMDFKAAQTLLRLSGQEVDPVEALVRVENIGFAHSVSEALSSLGLSVMNSNGEQQAKWDKDLIQATYLGILAGMALLFSALALPLWRKVGENGEKEGTFTLECLGMGNRARRRLWSAKAMTAASAGCAAGILMALLTPLLLTPDALETSVFAYPLPLWAMMLCVCLAMGTSMTAHLKRAEGPSS